MQKIEMISTAEHTFARKRVIAGETLFATPKEANLLRALGRAVDKPATQRQVARLEMPPVKSEGTGAAEAPVSTVTAKAQQYERRDLQAVESSSVTASDAPRQKRKYVRRSTTAAA